MNPFLKIVFSIFLLHAGIASAQMQYQVVKLMVTGHPNYKEDSLYDCHYVILKYKQKIVIGQDTYVIDSSYKMYDDPKETEYFCHFGKKFAAVFICYPVDDGSLAGESWWRANTAVNVIIDQKIFYYSANKIRTHGYVRK